jgi:thiamine kinase-like enzyme
MAKNAETDCIIAQPPADVPEMQRGDWLLLSPPDQVSEYLTVEHWDQDPHPVSWEVARLSQAAYVYRETATKWSVVAKFYGVKTGDEAYRYADREFVNTQSAQAADLTRKELRAVEPIATWRGILFLEYIDGLTLEDVIAVRRSRPGTLSPSLVGAARLLQKLHANSVQSGATPEFESALVKAHKYLRDLVRWGVLENDPVVRDALSELLERWSAVTAMTEYAPVLIHGDATTTNFMYPWNGGVVGVDWERLYAGDPAFDLGRLMAEASHSIHQHGGSVAEAVPFVSHLSNAYCQELGDVEQADALLERARFYQAASTLRIARNGWVSKLDRMGLVAQALALLGR